MVHVYQSEPIDKPVTRSEVIAEIKGIYDRPVILGRRNVGN